ncbi:unnamed protein product [Diplocarpon coronariae]
MASLIRRVQGCFPLTYYDLSDYPLTVEQKKWAQEGERIVRCRECSHYRCAACYDVEANDEISHRCNGDERAKLPSSSVIPTSSGEPKPPDRRGPLAEEGPARKRRASAQLGRFGQPAGPSQAEGSGQAGTYYQFGGQNQAGPFAPFEEPSHFNHFREQNQAGAFAPFGGPSYFNRFEGQNQAGAFALFGGPSQTREPGQGGALTQFEVLNQAGAFTPVELPTLFTQAKGPNKAGVLAPVRVPSHANQFGGPNQTWKTKGQGHNFAGFAHPFGMVKLGPDLVDGTDSCSGYLPNGNFSGFSMMHEQGTGGAAKYGTVAQPPLIGNISSPLSSITIGRIVPDQGSVGYYRAQTSEQVVVELAATSRAGMYQYAFPAISSQNNILSDGIGGFSNATPSTEKNAADIKDISSSLGPAFCIILIGFSIFLIAFSFDSLLAIIRSTISATSYLYLLIPSFYFYTTSLLKIYCINPKLEKSPLLQSSLRKIVKLLYSKGTRWAFPFCFCIIQHPPI